MDIIASIFTPEVTAALTTAVVGIITTLISATLVTGINLIRSKTSQTQFEFLQHAASVAVSAAEQLGVNGVIDDKKGYAFDALSAELARRGIKVDADALEAAIEAAVMDAFNTPIPGDDARFDATPSGS